MIHSANTCKKIHSQTIAHTRQFCSPFQGLSTIEFPWKIALTSVEMWFTSVALVSLTLAFPVRLTPRSYMEVISAARASTPVAIDRQKNCNQMLKISGTKRIKAYLLGADASGDGEEEQAQSHADTETNTRAGFASCSCCSSLLRKGDD
jgi:hypothetical protein